MVAPKQSNYAPCPACAALNMTHRTTCYKCGGTLSSVAAQIAKVEHQASYNQFRPIAQDTRREPRYEVRFEDPVLEVSSDDPNPLRVRDISPAGISIYLPSPRLEETQVRLQIPLAGGMVELSGVVRHCEPALTEAGRGFVLGIEFVQVDEELRILLDHELGGRNTQLPAA